MSDTSRLFLKWYSYGWLSLCSSNYSAWYPCFYAQVWVLGSFSKTRRHTDRFANCQQSHQSHQLRAIITLQHLQFSRLSWLRASDSRMAAPAGGTRWETTSQLSCGRWRGIISGYERQSHRRWLCAASVLFSHSLPAGEAGASKEAVCSYQVNDKKSTQQVMIN